MSTREPEAFEVGQAFLPVPSSSEQEQTGRNACPTLCKALRVERKTLRVREIEKPTGGDEALVRVHLSGICNTDLEIARGYAGFKGTLGHEFVGVVEESPGDVMLGQRVVGEINAGCGQCELCKAGDPRHCATRTVLGIHGRDGAHAEFLRLPLANLIAVPDAIEDEHAVFTEPLAAACGILERVAIDKQHAGRCSRRWKTRLALRPGDCIEWRARLVGWQAR